MSIKVAVRARPFSEAEARAKCKCVIAMNGRTVEVFEDGTDSKPTHQFTFDHAFWSVNAAMPLNRNPLAPQESVYEQLGLPVIDHVVTGYNACVFAYGQTGSGKTYTMMGTPGQETAGVIPRIASSIFSEAANLARKGIQVIVELSFFEIYCEKVRCLLNPDADGRFSALRVREHPVTGPYVEGLARMAIKTEDEFLKLVEDGGNVRITAATDMNAQSSRSHAVCTVYVSQKTTDGPVHRTKQSKLNLVDLAGSERADKTNATGARLVEGSNINKSLSALGLVISSLSDMFEQGGKPRHIPYRDSILTWILKDNLGGNSKTVMIAAISPSSDQLDETLGTLRYAERAKKIVNKAVINESNDNQLIAELQNQIAALKSQMSTSQSSTEKLQMKDLLEENERAMADMKLTLTEKLAAAEQILAEREEKMKALLHEKELHINRLQSELGHVKNDLEEREEMIRLLKEKLARKEAKAKQAREEEEEADRLRREISDLETGTRRPPQQRVAGQVSVKALAKAYEKMGQSPEVRYTKYNMKRDDSLLAELGITDKQAANQALPKPGQPQPAADDELDLDLDDDLELDLGDDDVPNEQPKAEDELDLDVDDLDIEDEPAQAGHPPAGEEDELLNLDLEDEVELDLDEDDGGAKHKEEDTSAQLDVTDLDEHEPDVHSQSLKGVDLEEAKGQGAATTTTRDQRARAHTVTKAPESGPSGPKPSPTVVATLVVPSHALPNNRYLREPFRVIKVDEGALISRTKDRVWDVDFFGRRFNNMDLGGNISFSMNSAHLFRVEKHWSDSKKLTLYFFDAPHPYELVLSSTERRQRLYELAMIQRRNAILWCPSLCPDEDNDAVIQVVGTTIDRANGRQVKVKGEGKFLVARMPYEVIDFWFGCFSLQQKPLPATTAMLTSFVPRGTNEVYIIGVCDVPGSLMGNPALGDFFLQYLGSAYFVLKQTCLEARDKPKKTNNAMIVIVRRSFIVRMCHCEGVELGSVKKHDANKGDFSAVACTMVINETSIACVLVNATPFMEDNNFRSSNIRALVSALPLGDSSIDITSRFDYLLVGGAFGFANSFKPNDVLVQQMKAGTLLTEFQEAAPSDHLKGLLNPMRILYLCRPRNCRIDVKSYDSDPHIRLSNVSVSADIFTQRAFLSTFGEAVPNVVFYLSNIAVKPTRVPPITHTELHVIAPWMDGSPLVNPLHRNGDGLSPSGPMLPVKPVVHNYDFLRLQSLQFTLFGVVSNSPDKKKGVIASGSLSLKNNFTLGEPMAFTINISYRTCVVGTITGTILQVNVGEAVKTSSGPVTSQAAHTLVVQCDENQAKDNDGGWVATLYPAGPWDWSDPRNPAKQARREQFVLPNQSDWSWAGEWKHESRPDCKEGWCYATDFTTSDFTYAPTPKHRARRRRWTRVMQAKDALTLHNYVKTLNLV